MNDIFVADKDEEIQKVLKGKSSAEKGEADYVLVVTSKRIVKVELNK